MHVGEALPNGTGKAMLGLCLAMNSFNQSTVAAVERPLARSPAGVFAAGAQQGGIVLVQQDGARAHGSAEANRTHAAGPTVRDASTIVLEPIAVGHGVRADLSEFVPGVPGWQGGAGVDRLLTG